MKKYHIDVLEDVMCEDELSEDIPEWIYDFWFELSEVPDGVGVRMGPKITEVES